MSLKNKMIVFSITLTLLGSGLIWYLTSWKVIGALWIFIWGQNLQMHAQNGQFGD